MSTYRLPLVSTTLLIILLLCGGLIAPVPARAQDALDDVYATMQYNVSLRAGPGINWERLAVLDFGTTYRATGRTQDASWLQIAYTGDRLTDAYPEATIDGVTYGWVQTSLPFWTGNMLALPVDGVRTVDFVRGTLRTVLITPDMPIYTGIIGAQQRVDYPLAGPAYVEATAYFGDSDFVWVQFKIGANFYWVSALGSYRNLPNAAMLIAGGRLEMLVNRNLTRLWNTYNDLYSRWWRLSSGQPVSCNNLPGEFALIRLLDNDLAREPLYAAIQTGLGEAEAAINRAAARLREVCSTPQVKVPASAVGAALADLESAEQSLSLVALLQAALSNEGAR